MPESATIPDMELLGHRGLGNLSVLPENTLGAVESALAGGADGVEVDVRVTVDDVAVCVHDPDLRRVAGARLPVASSRYSEVRSTPLAGGHVVPRLDDVLDIVKGRGVLILDLKDVPGRRAALVAAVTSAMRRADASDVVISSFSPPVLDAIGLFEPRLRRALITDRNVPAAVALHRAVAKNYDDIHPHVRAMLADHTVTERAAGLGRTVRCWTVNRAVDARLLEIAGVSGAITDDPQGLRRGLADSSEITNGPHTSRAPVTCAGG